MGYIHSNYTLKKGAFYSMRYNLGKLDFKKSVLIAKI